MSKQSPSSHLLLPSPAPARAQTGKVRLFWSRSRMLVGPKRNPAGYREAMKGWRQTASAWLYFTNIGCNLAPAQAKMLQDAFELSKGYSSASAKLKSVEKCMRKNSMHPMNIWRAYKLLTVGTLWNLETHNQLSLTTFTAFSGEFTRFVSFYYVLQVNLWSPCLRNFVNMPLLKVVLTASTRNPPSPISPLISPCRTRLW